MPMIEQIKNFIRHGKQANKNICSDNNGNHDHFPRSPIHAENYRVYPEIKSRADNSSAIQQIVAEEREQKSKMPTYPGLEHYRILEKMGDGAFSNVYKAIDTRTQEKVAIKVVRKHELNHSQKFSAAFKRTFNVLKEKHLHRDMKKKPRVIERANILKEVQIMRQLKHPSIVSLLSFSESPDYYYLILELMEGGELFHQIVKFTYFSEPLSRHVIVQVAEGLRYLHEEKGIVHRDIKPENLLFEPIPIIPSKTPPPVYPGEELKDDEGEFTPGLGGGGIGKIKIADFGLSKVVWDEQTMTPCGTVGYTAPEIVKDERYSKSVDMWALGCVLYTMLCGFPPFYDESINDLTEKVVKGQYTFLSPWWDDISASSKDLISNLLTVDPEKRYTINQFFEHPWIKDEAFLPKTTTEKKTKTIKTEARNRYANVDSPLIYDEMLHTPGDNFRRKDLLSPSISLKEAFEVTYAVHRMEEEGAKRRKMKNVKGGALNPFKGRFNLNDDDEDFDDTSTASSVHQVPISEVVPSTNPTSNESVKTKSGPKVTFTSAKRNKEIPRVFFDLNMNNATLLGRRKKAAYKD